MGTVGIEEPLGIERTVWGQCGDRGDRGDGVRIEGQCEAADDCGLEEGTARRCRGAVRGLHRAGADFITHSITDSDHISGGRGRSAQAPALIRGLWGLPGCQGMGAGLAPPGRAPCTHQPGWTRGAPCGSGITPNWPCFPPGFAEKLLRTSWQIIPAHPPSLEQPHTLLQGQLLVCNPSTGRAHQHMHPRETPPLSPCK